MRISCLIYLSQSATSNALHKPTLSKNSAWSLWKIKNRFFHYYLVMTERPTCANFPVHHLGGLVLEVAAASSKAKKGSCRLFGFHALAKGYRKKVLCQRS